MTGVKSETYGKILVLAGIVCMVVGASWGLWCWLASSGRQLQRRPAVVFVLDSSRSMLASSGSGSRLDVGKGVIRGIAERLEGIELGLVTFSGEAMVDFPPSVDREGFLVALESVSPLEGAWSGSNPESGLVLGEGLCEGFGVVILVTDGEEEVLTRGRVGWVSRRTPLGWCVVGGSSAMPIPLGESWLRDPDTGEIAMSQADEEQVRQWAELSSAVQVRLSSGGMADTHVALVKGLLEQVTSRRLEAQSEHGSGDWAVMALGLAGAALIMGGLWCGRRSLLVACLLLCGGMAPGEGRAPSPAEELQTLRKGLSGITLTMDERGRLLSNGSGMFWRLGKEKERSLQERLDLVREGLAWGREALRCGVGEAAAVNLNLLLILEQHLEEERLAALRPEGRTAGGQEEGQQAGARQQTSERKGVNVDDVLGMAGSTAPAPTRVGEGPQIPERKQKDRRTGEIGHGRAASWRTVLERDRSVRGRRPGVKPW